MAWKVRYRCNKCGYEADVYEGVGFMQQHIETISCPDCHTLQPMVVGGILARVAPSLASTAGRLCLNCGSQNFRIWNGHSCPKCGGEMTPTGERHFWT